MTKDRNLLPDATELSAEELEEFRGMYRQSLQDDYYNEIMRLYQAGEYPDTTQGREQMYEDAWVTARQNNALGKQVTVLSTQRRTYRETMAQETVESPAGPALQSSEEAVYEAPAHSLAMLASMPVPVHMMSAVHR